MEKIVEYTNKKLEDVRSTLGPGTNKSNYKKISIEEINALLLSSVLKSNNEKILSMFSKDAFSRPIFSATMSEKRFVVLISCLRFDDSCTRTQQKENDKAAPISEIFKTFIQNSQSVYCVSSELTVDEMLIPFRGRCGFRVYAKEVWHQSYQVWHQMETSYLLNAYI